MLSAQADQGKEEAREVSQEQFVENTEDEVKQIIIKQEQVIIEPMEKMNKDIEYSVMYQPVYFSIQDRDIYVAGPLIQQLPKEETDFSKLFCDAMKKTGAVFEKAWDASKPAFVKFGHATAEFSVKTWISFIKAMTKISLKNKQEKSENNSEYHVIIDTQEVSDERTTKNTADEEQIVHRNEKVANSNANADDNDSLLGLVL